MVLKFRYLFCRMQPGQHGKTQLNLLDICQKYVGCRKLNCCHALSIRTCLDLQIVFQFWASIIVNNKFYLTSMMPTLPKLFNFINLTVNININGG